MKISEGMKFYEAAVGRDIEVLKADDSTKTALVRWKEKEDSDTCLMTYSELSKLEVVK